MAYCAAVNKDLGHQKPRIIGPGLHRAISAGRHDRQEITRRRSWQLTRQREIIAGFADRADDIGGDFRAGLPGANGKDLMVRVVKRRADKIVHRRIDNDEGFGLAPLHVEDACDENAGVARDQPSRLEDQAAVERPKPCLDDRRIALRVIALWILPVSIRDAETAAEIDMLKRVAIGAQHPRQNRRSGGTHRRMGRGP